MDSVDEDISARVLLRRVLNTELPRSPVTRSGTRLRRSMRSKNTPGLESPGVALRHRLKKKLHESASHSPVPPPKRQKSLGGKTNPPSASPLYDEDITTRGLLKGIIQTETETSLLMSGQPLLQNSEPNAGDSSASSTGDRTEGLSGVELSDLTLHTEPLTHVVRGLSRKKPQRAFSVSWFEKELEQLPGKSEVVADVSQEKQDISQDLDFSAGSRSGLNLTLKTPFVEKRTERAGLQRKVSNRRLPSVDAFDEAVQRCLEQGYVQGNSVFQDGKTLEDSSWQKLTLGLSDVTELYVQPTGSTAQPKKHETLVPSAELEREHDLESNGEEILETQDGDIPEVPELLTKDKEHEMESASQDVEQVEMVPSSQEAGDGMSLSYVNEIVLAPTQAMTESLTESLDVEMPETQTEEEVEEENVPGDMDASTNQERITRRAHRSEGRGVVLGVPPGSRVTKSLGTGLNPREKDLLDFVNGSRENLQNIPDEEIEPQDGPLSPPLYPAAEVNTPERRSQKLESSLAEEDLPEYAGDDAPEEINQSEEEDMVEPEAANQSAEPHSCPPDEEEDIMIEPEAANQSAEPHSPAPEEEDLIDSEPDNRSTKPQSPALDEEEEDLIDSEPDNRSTKPQSPALDEEEEDLIDSEPDNRSTKPQSPALDEEEEDLIDSEPDNRSAEPQSPALDEQEDIMMEPEAANQSAEPHSPAPDEEEDDDDDDARSAELSLKTPAFIRQKRAIASPCALDTPTVLKQLNAGTAPQVAKRARRQKRQTGNNVLPKSYIMSVFKHFAKTKVASDVFPAINEILRKYFDRLADDLEAYAAHAKRKTIEVEDFELLMRRQGFVTDNTPVNILIEKYLPLEYRKLLIPVATSGNKVIPNQRR
ncbi:uncharacterized protein cenpt [Xyrauchen texanus]|uniref:uncharacterized protein cenpt n=1 Tax=Xyrauchen texanus TaxID=154827 RepID=UPI0022420215|nr:uncharacterized protein cenpt [Xyrauchen texanus]